jgi:parallel beta-helix repeat protein
VAADSSGNTIHNNVVENNLQDGIRVGGDDSDIHHNTSCDNGVLDVELTETSAGNKVHHNTYGTFQDEGNGNTVFRNDDCPG